MGSLEIVEGIMKLNLNEMYTNQNHDQKLVRYFNDLHKSNDLDLEDIPLACETLQNDYGFDEKITQVIERIAYYISLI